MQTHHKKFRHRAATGAAANSDYCKTVRNWAVKDLTAIDDAEKAIVDDPPADVQEAQDTIAEYTCPR